MVSGSSWFLPVHVAAHVHRPQLCLPSLGLSCGGCAGAVLLASTLSGGVLPFSAGLAHKSWCQTQFPDSHTLKVAFCECDSRNALPASLPLGARWRRGLCEWRLLLSPNNSDASGCLCTNVRGRSALCAPVSEWLQRYFCASVSQGTHGCMRRKQKLS